MGLRETTRKIDRRSIRLWAFGLLVAATWLGLRRLAPFADRGVSEGILALELSADGQLAQGLVEDIDAAQQALLYDFAFIAGYTVALMLALWLLVPLFRLNLLRTNVRALAIAPLAAAALDAAENVLLLIGTGPGEWADGWFQAAAALAFAKFVIIVGLLLLLVGAAASGLTTPQWLYTRMAAEPRRQQVKLPDLAPQRGIALSGGGVRAASVSLGALQELEQGPTTHGLVLTRGHQGDSGLRWRVHGRGLAARTRGARRLAHRMGSSGGQGRLAPRSNTCSTTSVT